MSSNSLNPFVPLTPGHSPFDVIKHVRADGEPYWSARELMPYAGYKRWESMLAVVARARLSAQNAGVHVESNFLYIKGIPSKTKSSDDYHLSRYACNLIFMVGDPTKPEIALAQAYFSIMTEAGERGIGHIAFPWAARIRETVIPHTCYLNVHYRGLGHWTVVSQLVPHMILLEEELRHHRMPTKSSDLPDDSVGSRWAHHRRKLERELVKLGGAQDDPSVVHFGPSSLRAPLTFPDRPKPVHVIVYDNRERPFFDKLFADTYLNTGLQSYLDGKPEFKPFDPCARASVATNVSEGLRGVPALIRCDHARRIARAGGRFVAGRPALECTQKGLF